jgi:hypothetical protein
MMFLYQKDTPMMETYQFPYLSPHQSRARQPSEWEIALAGAIEHAFSKGNYELDALIAALNASRVRPQQGGMWTPQIFNTLMHELGA